MTKVPPREHRDTPDEPPAWSDPDLTVDENGRTTYYRAPDARFGAFDAEVDVFLAQEDGVTSIHIGPHGWLALDEAPRYLAALADLISLGRQA